MTHLLLKVIIPLAKVSLNVKNTVNYKFKLLITNFSIKTQIKILQWVKVLLCMSKEVLILYLSLVFLPLDYKMQYNEL